ncbi:MAG: RNA 2',3'-cyclic phosphodiesterase [Propioniciclava sp.]
MLVAVVPPPEVVADLDEFLEPRRHAGAFRWTLAEQFHITLALCAQVPERSLDDLGERLQRAAGRRSRFEAQLAGGGAFPHAVGARLLWVGLGADADGTTELERLATGARAAISKAGIAVGGDRFGPHLTVARLKRPQEVSNWVRLFDAYAGPQWTVDEVTLVESHLGQGPRKRPRHEVVARYALSHA